MRKHFIEASAALLSLLTVLCACARDTQHSLIREHELDSLIERAGKVSSVRTDINEFRSLGKLSFEIEDDKLGVTAVADAEISIPQTDSVSVYGVRCASFTQELTDAVRRELMGNAKIYDGGALKIRTKADITVELEMLERELLSFDNGEYPSETVSRIEQCREEYENAPDVVDIEKYPSDGNLSSPSTLLESGELSEYYSWAASLNPEGEILYAVTDGADGNYSVFYVQNCPAYGNKLVFRTNHVSWESHDGVIAGMTSFETTDQYESFPENFLVDGTYYSSEPNLACANEREPTITVEEAKRISEEFLTKFGFADFVFSEGGLYSEPLRLDSAEGYYYGTYYILRYMRCIDGIMLTQPSGTKTDFGSENGVGKRMWSAECIEFRVNDEGIVGLDINAPLEITEKVSDNPNLESLDSVCATVEKLLPITVASDYCNKNIVIDSVSLCNSRISEEDSFDTGIIIPVWDITGVCEYISDGYVFRKSKESLMVINAMDGSVIGKGS